MFEIIKNRLILPEGKEITTYTREIISANLLEVEAGTTGFMGGDSGHGGRTYFRITDLGSTEIRVYPTGEKGEKGFQVLLGGDCELDTIIKALKFITKVLEEESQEVDD